MYSLVCVYVRKARCHFQRIVATAYRGMAIRESQNPSAILCFSVTGSLKIKCVYLSYLPEQKRTDTFSQREKVKSTNSNKNASGSLLFVLAKKLGCHKHRRV